MWKPIFLMLMAILALCSNLHAGPALQSFIDIEQPDGTTFKARQQGDEFQHWTETKNGHTVLLNSKTKYWDYAEQDADGNLKASGYRALEQGLAPSHIPPRLKPPRNKELEKYKEQSLNKIYQQRLQRSSSLSPSSSSLRRAPGDWIPMPVSGVKPLLLVRINFTNRTLITNLSINPSTWETTVFSSSPTDKSVARYFADNSFSSFGVIPANHFQDGSPPGIITVSINRAHPGADDSFNTERNIISLALTEANGLVQFGDFDTNGDNTLDPSELAISFIYAGYEASGSNKTPSVWAHAWGGDGGVTAGGFYFTDWAISGELNDATRQQGMGIIAHELGHTLCGLPDLYDISGINAGMGIFSLMANGSWGAVIGEDKGTTPTNLDLWSREYLGWATPPEPGNLSALTINSSLSTPASGLKLQTTAGSTEYFLLENRYPTGWDLGAKDLLDGGSIWEGGLLLTHIDLAAGTVGANDINDSSATGGRQGVLPVQAGNTESCNMAARPNCWGDKKTLFYAGNNATWTPFTVPDSDYYDGTPTNFSLTSISVPGTTMTAEWSTNPDPVLPVADDFESNDLTKLPWIGTWTVTPSGFNSTYAAQAPPLQDGESAILETTVITGDGNLSFRYKVDAEIGDRLTFSIDGVVQRFWAGVVDWSQIFYPITAGKHRLTWEYEKDLDISSGLDTAWIDDLSFPPGYELTITLEGLGLGNVTPNIGNLTWTGLTGSAIYNNGTNVTLTANAATNSIFTGWGLPCSGIDSCVITMDAAKNVTATFAASPVPIATTASATAISTSSATLNAVVNANNSDTTVRFQYGTDPFSYSSFIDATTSVTGLTDTAVSATPTGLSTDTTYYFRVIATNGSGTSYGNQASFFVLRDQSISAITFSPPTLAVNGTTAASATASSGLAVSLTSTTPTVCTISGSTVTGVTAGTCTIAANQPGNALYIAAPTVSQDITVAKGDQSIGAITFLPADLAVFGTTTANASATSGLDVTLTSTTPTVCTINGSTVTAVATGTCTIAANQPGDVNYNTAIEVTKNITVTKANQTLTPISFLPATLAVNGATTATTTASSGLAVVLTSTTPTVCTINGSNVTGVAAGTCTIAANQSGNAYYNAATEVTQNITVKQSDQSIGTITFLPTTLTVKSSTTASASATSGLAVIWSSSTPGVCTVNATTGVVLGVTVGTCTITANQAGDAIFTPAPPVTQSFAVAKGTPLITWATPADIVYGTALSATQLNANANGVSGIFVYTPSAGSVLNAGPQALTATFIPADSTNYSTPASVAVAINVATAGQAITLGIAPTLTYGGASASVSATGGASGQPVTFTSLTSGVCTVSGATVTPVTAGTCTIAAGQAGTSNFTPAAQVTQNITVNKATPLITWATPADIVYGTALSATQLNANANGVSGIFVYAPLAGSVLNAGTLQPLTATFTPTDPANYSTPASVAVAINVAAAGQTITFGPPPALTYGGATATVSATGGASGQPVTFSSLTNGVCSISGTTLTPITAGTCTIAANQAGNANYSAAPLATHSFAVVKATPLITWATPADIVYGTPLSATQLNANAYGVSGIFAYAPSAGTVLNAGAQALTATFIPVDSANYNMPSQVAVAINVVAAGQTITFGTTPALTYGGASASVSASGGASGQPVTFSSMTSGVCSINGTTVTPIAAGTCTIAANQTGNANYNAALQATQSFTIAKATPLITWATPVDIVYGTALSATQLNADANGVSGTFVYTPSTGTVLNAGTLQSLTATFTPSDPANYRTPPSVTVEINVLAAGQTIGTITFTPASLTVNGTTTASATATSGLAVSWSSTSLDICTIDASSGVVTGSTAGTCSIAANQAGNANYSAAPQATQSFTIAKATPLITWATPADIVYGTALSVTQLNANANGVNGTFVYTPAAGTVLNAGISSLTATFTPADTDNYSTPPSVTVEINVLAAAQTIGTITFTPASLTVNGTTTASATATSGLAVSWSSTSLDICTIDASSGVVTGSAAGTCTIAANQAGDANYNAAPQFTQDILVGKADQTITEISFLPTSLAVNGTTEASATVTSGLAVSWSSTSLDICTVDAFSGVVTGNTAGTCTIAANQAGDANYNAAPQFTEDILVGKADQTITAISFLPTSLAVNGATTASASASSGLSVTWSSTTPTICTVNPTTGVIAGSAAGTCTIAANQSGDATFNAAAPVSQSITIDKADQTITAITFLPASLAVNGTTTASAAATSGLAITWSSTTPACSVDASSGVVAGITAGICTIEANQAGDANYNAAPPLLSQDITIDKANQSIGAISFSPASLVINSTTTASAIASSGLAVSWSSTTPLVCTVNASTGVVAGSAAGTCNIVASQLGNAIYNAATPVPQNISVGNAYGDIDDIPGVTAADALLALQMAIRKIPVDMQADIAPLSNGAPAPDGKVTAADAWLILRKAVGLW